MTVHDDFGFACTHWVLGGLVLIGLSTSEYSGAGTLVALLISATSVSLSAICGLQYVCKNTSKRELNDVTHFLIIWLNILELLMAAATCARVASATIDYTSEEKLRSWLFGLESHSLGEPWPDVLGVTIIAVITVLFMLGLEKSQFFCILLCATIGIGFTFFVSVGGRHTDIKFWNWTEDFQKRTWECILITAALCSYGFINSFSIANGSRICMKIAASIIIPLICYASITLIFTFMSHYREVAGTAIPLIRIFEIRDVEWARLIMAMCTICAVCLVLTEIMPPLYDLLTQLAEKNWQILVSPILYRSTITGAPVLAIFATGSLSSIFAFACPLSYLVRLLNASSLLKSALKSSTVLYNCYRSNLQLGHYLVQGSNVQYSKLNHETVPKKPVTRSSRSTTPWYLWPIKRAASNRYGGDKMCKDVAEDKEYLLLDQYSNNYLESYAADGDSSSESDGNEVLAPVSDDDSNSSTDIDAIVQEYKDRLQVTTSKTFSEQKVPSACTSKVVLLIIFATFIVPVLLSTSISSNNTSLAWASSAVLVLCVLLLCLMPQRAGEEPKKRMIHRLIPYMSLFSIVLNILLCSSLLRNTWPGLLFWIASGLMIFYRCGCCSCDESRDVVSIYRRSADCSLCEMPASEKLVDTVVVPR